MLESPIKLLTAALAVLALAGPGPCEGGPQAPGAGSSEAASGLKRLVAFLPIENLSEAAAPLAEIHESLREKLERSGMPLLDGEALEGFMQRHRMRYIGGLAREMGAAFRSETGAEAVLVTSLDLYREESPPRIAMTSRLISTGEDGRILWMDGMDRSGDEALGFLSLGRIEDVTLLREEILDHLAGSLALALADSTPRPPGARAVRSVPRRFLPRSYYATSGALPSRQGVVRVAILPYSNQSTSRHAGDIVTLQILRHLTGMKNVEVIEPGVVREVLLRSRLIQEEGLSVPQTDLLRSLLDADIVVFGEVSEYLEVAWGGMVPEVEFSVRAIDTASRRLIWSSSSHARGDDGVIFFDVGRIPTAHRLASELARGADLELLPALGAS